MAPCSIQWACSGVTQTTTLFANGQTITVCSNYPPFPDPNNCNGTIIVTPRGICINGQCESTCECYGVQNQSQNSIMVYWIDCNTSATSSQLFASGEYQEICSLNIPSGPYGVPGIVANPIGNCVAGNCVLRPTSDYYAIRVEDIYLYLGDSAAEDEHIQYVVCQGFEIYQIYGMYDLFYNTVHNTNPTGISRLPLLPAFLTKLYNAGLKPVAILGARQTVDPFPIPDIYGGTQNDTSYSIYTDLAAWETNTGIHAGTNPNQIKFWGVNKENYFWECENGTLCDSEHESWGDWIYTICWLRAGFGTWHNWHISCLVDRYIDPNTGAINAGTFDIVKASQLINCRPDVIEIRNQVGDTTFPPLPFDPTIGGTPYPTAQPYLDIVNVLQSAAGSLGVSQQVSPYWNAGSTNAAQYLGQYATHGPAYLQVETVYNSTVAPTTPNLDMQGLTMYTYNNLQLCEPACIPGYTTTTTTGGVTVTTTVPPPGTIPQYNKIFVLWLNNRGFNNLLNSTNAFYLTSIIKPAGVTMGGVMAQSVQTQPNYLAAFAGDTFGVVDNTPWTPINGHNFPNLVTELAGNGKTFASYIQSVYTQNITTGNWNNLSPYQPWKDPSINFSNLGILPQAGIRKNWTAFPANLAYAEDVCFLIPDTRYDMTNSIQAADFWLWITDPNQVVQRAFNYANNPANNSLFIVYGDRITGGDTRLPMVIVGNGVGGGATPVGGIVPWIFPTGHYSFLKTILRCMGVNTNIGNIGPVDTLVGWY